jgi:hypothetical protein
MTAGFLRRRPALDLDIHYIHRAILSGRTSLALINWRPSPGCRNGRSDREHCTDPCRRRLRPMVGSNYKDVGTLPCNSGVVTVQLNVAHTRELQLKEKQSVGPLLCSA